MADRFELQRFVDAQASVYSRVVAELRDGRKQSHWMWFIFPQIKGLGHSAMAQRYAVGSRDEAIAYLDHPLLGSRLPNARSWSTNGPAGRSGRFSALRMTSNSIRQ